MVNKDLQTFGKTLRYLRKTAGFSQEELAEKLSLIHAKADPATDLRLVTVFQSGNAPISVKMVGNGDQNDSTCSI